MKLIQIYIILTLFVSIPVLFSAEKIDDPSWVYLKKAENLKEMGEYAQAVLTAKKARKKFIKEQLAQYYEAIYETRKDKIEYELTQMVEQREQELYSNDNFPAYHELMGDLYILTDFLDEAEKEYKIALKQKGNFEYPQKEIEIQYKIADIYHFKHNYELEDIVYREIIKSFFSGKDKEYWARIKVNIKDDPTLARAFRIYSIDGIEYLAALFKIGRRASISHRKDEALFYLATAVIVWMTYYSKLIKKYHYDFKYSHPTDFINFISKNRLYEYEATDSVIDEILFYIGYVFYLENEAQMMEHYFNLAKIFSKNTEREEEIKNRIHYLYKDKNHILTYDEIF